MQNQGGFTMKENRVTSTLTNLFIAASLCISAYAIGMNSNKASDQTERSGFYSTIKTTDQCEIDEAVEKFMQDNAVPGMAIALVARPQMPIIWSKGYGVKSLDGGGEITRNTISGRHRSVRPLWEPPSPKPRRAES